MTCITIEAIETAKIQEHENSIIRLQVPLTFIVCLKAWRFYCNEWPFHIEGRTVWTIAIHLIESRSKVLPRASEEDRTYTSGLRLVPTSPIIKDLFAKFMTL